MNRYSGLYLPGYFLSPASKQIKKFWGLSLFSVFFIESLSVLVDNCVDRCLVVLRCKMQPFGIDFSIQFVELIKIVNIFVCKYILYFKPDWSKIVMLAYAL